MPKSYAIESAIYDLSHCLFGIEYRHKCFLDAPVRALGCFIEGPGERIDSAPESPLIAKYLGLPLDHVTKVEGMLFSDSKDAIHQGPYFVYLPTEEVADGVNPRAEIARQIENLSSSFDSIERALQQTRDEAVAQRYLPHAKAKWWEILFHLAVHCSEPLLHANRRRWLKIIGPDPGVDPRSTFPLRYPQESKVSEFRIQMGVMQAPFEDLVPRVMWSMLIDDVYTSTAQALKIISGMLKETNEPQQENPETIRATLGALRVRFEEWARTEEFGRNHLATSDSSSILQGGMRLVKVASTFETPPAHLWPGNPLGVVYQSLRLSQRYADAEYLLYGHQSEEIMRICSEAGQCLPASTPDHAVLFIRKRELPNGISFGQSCGMAYLNPEPTARWVRFVFNFLQQRNDCDLSIEWESDPIYIRGGYEPLYGSAFFDKGFANACVRAIDHLLETLPSPENSESRAGETPLAKPEETPPAIPANALGEQKPSITVPPVPERKKGGTDALDDLAEKILLLPKARRNAYQQYLEARKILGEDASVKSLHEWCKVHYKPGPFGAWKRSVNRAEEDLGLNPPKLTPENTPRSAVSRSHFGANNS